MKGYKTSKDYKRLKELLDKGYVVICIADYDHRDGRISRDICRAIRDVDTYYFNSRGISYTSYNPNIHRRDSFDSTCKESHIEFIEPTEEEQL